MNQFERKFLSVLSLKEIIKGIEEKDLEIKLRKSQEQFYWNLVFRSDKRGLIFEIKIFGTEKDVNLVSACAAFLLNEVVERMSLFGFANGAVELLNKKFDLIINSLHTDGSYKFN